MDMIRPCLSALLSLSCAHLLALTFPFPLCVPTEWLASSALRAATCDSWEAEGQEWERAEQGAAICYSEFPFPPSFRYSTKNPSLQSETVHYKRGVSQQFSLPSFKIDFSEWKDDEVSVFSVSPSFHSLLSQKHWPLFSAMKLWLEDTFSQLLQCVLWVLPWEEQYGNLAGRSGQLAGNPEKWLLISLISWLRREAAEIDTSFSWKTCFPQPSCQPKSLWERMFVVISVFIGFSFKILGFFGWSSKTGVSKVRCIQYNSLGWGKDFRNTCI